MAEARADVRGSGQGSIAEEMRRIRPCSSSGRNRRGGHPFKTLVGLVQEFGTERVIDTPISEPGYAGIGWARP